MHAVRPEVPLSLPDACASLPELWLPRVVASINDHFLKVVRIQGEFPWHTHKQEDELFLVIKGVLTIGRSEADGGSVTLQPGEIFVVPRGIRHNTSSTQETWIALVESSSTQHTGDEKTPLTRSIADQLLA